MDRLEQLEQFLKEQPRDEFLRYAIAQEYQKLGILDKSQAMYEQLLKDSPEYTATYYHLGKLYEKIGKKEEAKSIYKLGIELTEKSKEARTNSELKAALLELEYEDLI